MDHRIIQDNFSGRQTGWFRLAAGGVMNLSFILITLFWISGCGSPDRLNRPNLVCSTPDGQTLVIYDNRQRTVFVTDRSFRLKTVIRDSRFRNLWGMDTDGTRLVLANQRTLGFSRNPDQKKKMAIAELLFFDLTGNLLDSWTWQGEKGPVIDPRAVKLMDDGRILVSDIRMNCLVWLDSAGRKCGEIARYGFEPGSLFYPNDIQQTPEGDILVADSFNCRLQVFDAEGKTMKIVGAKGTGPDQFLFPQHASRNPSGSWFVTDLGNRRIVRLDSRLSPCGILNLPPQPNHPQLYDICFLKDPEILLVADSRNGCLHVFDAEGRWQRSIQEFAP